MGRSVLRKHSGGVDRSCIACSCQSRSRLLLSKFHNIIAASRVGIYLKLPDTAPLWGEKGALDANGWCSVILQSI